jgi:hypothetical protein
MRGTDQRPGELFSYVDIEARVPSTPLRRIRELVNAPLARLDKSFAKLYCPRQEGAQIAIAPAAMLHDNPNR